MKLVIRSKIKPVGQEERLQKWKEYFKNLLGNLSEITDKITAEITNGQSDIKLGHFEDEFDALLKTNKSRKAADFDEITPEVWKIRKVEDVLLQLCNAVYKQNKEMNEKLHSLPEEK